jgi:hypothetical protein
MESRPPKPRKKAALSKRCKRKPTEVEKNDEVEPGPESPLAPIDLSQETYVEGEKVDIEQVPGLLNKVCGTV